MVNYSVKNYKSKHGESSQACFRINAQEEICLVIQTNNLGEFYFWNRNQTFLRVHFKLT